MGNTQINIIKKYLNNSNNNDYKINYDTNGNPISVYSRTLKTNIGFKRLIVTILDKQDLSDYLTQSEIDELVNFLDYLKNAHKKHRTKPIKRVNTTKDITTQTNLVLEHLKTYGSINNFEAVEKYKIFSLSRIICYLRTLGYKISTTKRFRQTNPLTGRASSCSNYVLKQPKTFVEDTKPTTTDREYWVVMTTNCDNNYVATAVEPYLFDSENSANRFLQEFMEDNKQVLKGQFIQVFINNKI
jgi:hypothetical protein